MPLALVYHPRFLDHRQADALHPERPERLVAVRERLEAEGLWGTPLSPCPASMEALARAHDPAYLKKLAAFGPAHWDPDTWIGPDTFEIARLASGAAMFAAETAWRDGAPALALVRPPGHHATRDRAMGFCCLNHVAVAALDRLENGARRIAIVDLDVHHGNGTQDIFYRRDDVLCISLHQWPFYPGTGAPDEIGEGAGKGFNLNITLPPGSGDDVYAAALERIVEPVLEQFLPDMILVPLGADAHYMDPLANMALTTEGCLALLARLTAAANRLCGGRFAASLEGGYRTDALADVIAGWKGQAEGQSIETRFNDCQAKSAAGHDVVEKLATKFGLYWPALL